MFAHLTHSTISLHLGEQKRRKFAVDLLWGFVKLGVARIDFQKNQ
jgi:hypothetical protein